MRCHTYMAKESAAALSRKHIGFYAHRSHHRRNGTMMDDYDSGNVQSECNVVIFFSFDFVDWRCAKSDAFLITINGMWISNYIIFLKRNI